MNKIKTTYATDTDFILVAPLYRVPVGATGQLKRIDDHHVALIFDHHEDLVFDLNDTEPEVWAAIKKQVVVPTCAPLALAASVLLALVVGCDLWAIDP